MRAHKQANVNNVLCYKKVFCTLVVLVLAYEKLAT